METRLNNKAGSNVKANLATILLVEDDPVVLSTTARVLNRFGYEVLPYRHAREALASATRYEGEIHLLITDVMMPEMNGGHLAQGLRQHSPDLPVLYMSGYTDDILAEHGIRRENTHFVGKPFTPQELAAKVSAILRSDFQVEGPKMYITARK